MRRHYLSLLLGNSRQIGQTMSLDQTIELTVGLRVKWIVAGGLGRLVAPVLIDPHPVLRVRPDGRLKEIPARLRDLLQGSIRRQGERFMEDYPASPIRLGPPFHRH